MQIPMHEQSMNHISLKKYADSPTVQDALNKCQASSPHWGDRKMGIAISCAEYSLMAGLMLDLAINLHHTLTRYSAGSPCSYVVQKIIIWESCGGGGEANVRMDTAALQQQNGSKENWQHTDLHFAGNIIQSCTAGRKIFTGLVFIQEVREGVAIASACGCGARAKHAEQSWSLCNATQCQETIFFQLYMYVHSIEYAGEVGPAYAHFWLL